MQTRTAFLVLTALVFAPVGRAQQADMDLARLARIPKRLGQLVDDGSIPGAVSLVARHGRILELDAVGSQDIEAKKPMATGSIFQIMSMTKPFTGVAAMMLVEEGKLELRRPVEDYLPEFKGQLIEEKRADGSTDTHAPAHPPTVWELMCHTSGLAGDPDGALEDNPRTMRVPLAEAVRFYSQQRLRFEPGTKWSYSNMGIATLGRIVEVVSGEDYVHFVETHILQPLGMKDTFFHAPEDKRARVAMVYKHENGKLVRSGAEILAGDPAKFREGAKYPAPEFGLYSTASDLFRFYQMLLDGGTYGGHRFLSHASLDVMTRVHTPDVNPSGWLGGTGYGLTFEIVNSPRGMLLLHPMGTFGHGGAFGTEGWMDPVHGVVRILMIQVSDDTAGPARAAVMQMGEAAVLK